MVRPVTYAPVAALAFSALVACSSTTEPSADATAESSKPTTSAASAVATQATPAAPRAVTKQWVDLTVGECVAEVPAVDVGEATVTVVDCTTPHRAEVYLLAPVAVNAAIADVADRECAAGVGAYAGSSAGLSVTYLIDSKQDRTGAIPLPSTVICLLQSVGGDQLTGTVRQ